MPTPSLLRLTIRGARLFPLAAPAFSIVTTRRSFENSYFLAPVVTGDLPFEAFTRPPPFFGWLGQLVWQVCSGLKNNVMAKSLQASHEPSAGPLGIQTIKVVPAHFAVLDSIAKHTERDGEDSVCQRHNGLAHAMFACFAVKERRQIAVLLPRRSPSGLAKCAAQPSISLACPIAQPFPAAFVIAGTESRPTGRMLGTGENPHIRP
jgi:hypothetical protein